MACQEITKENSQEFSYVLICIQFSTKKFPTEKLFVPTELNETATELSDLLKAEIVGDKFFTKLPLASDDKKKGQSRDPNKKKKKK